MAQKYKSHRVHALKSRLLKLRISCLNIGANLPLPRGHPYMTFTFFGLHPLSLSAKSSLFHAYLNYLPPLSLLLRLGRRISMAPYVKEAPHCPHLISAVPRCFSEQRHLHPSPRALSLDWFITLLTYSIIQCMRVHNKLQSSSSSHLTA